MTNPMHYVDPPDCPEGMTLSAWRAERCRPARRGLLARLFGARRARRAAARAAA